MCGIAGLLGVDPGRAPAAAEAMQRALRHRGPDDRGLEIVERPASTPAVLVHTRLSIVELSAAGHQPMSDARNGSPNWVTFNGEIYNYREIWPALEHAGFPCRTRSDTEVLLKGYRAWGLRSVERYQGMFAFGLLDTERGVAWLCRDRLGIKPLYYYRPPDGGLVFASEVRALLASGLVPRKLRPGAVESFLAQGAVMEDLAIVEGVRALPAGSSLLTDFEGRELKQVRYWSVAFEHDAGAVTAPADGSSNGARASAAGPALFRSEVVAELRNALTRSVAQELLADVPLGLFLSSGIDSTALAVLAGQAMQSPLRTLSVGFDVADFDESHGAELTAKTLGTDHVTLALSGDGVLASFDDVLSGMDQPTVDGFNVYFVSKAARGAGLTVALSGLGGDELFGGYASFRDVPRALHLGRWVGHAVHSQRGRDRLASSVGALGTGFGLRARSRALAKLTGALRRPPDPKALYFLRRELFSPEERRALHELPPGSDPWSGIDRDTLDTLGSQQRGSGPGALVACLEVESYMRQMLLRDTDVFSMAHGLEVRVPLLGQRVVEEAARAPDAWRLPDPRPKPLLLDAVGGAIPRRTWAAKKRGFTFPWGSWLRGPLRARVQGALSGGGLSAAGLEIAAARDIWQRFEANDPSVSPLEILAMLVLDAVVEREGLRA